MDHDFQTLTQAVERFSRAMAEYATIDQPAAPFPNYPHQCCGHASSMLARYLKEHGFGEALYVRGSRPHPPPDVYHAWLELETSEIGTLKIDITAWQFEGHPHLHHNHNIPKIIVESEHPFYSNFRTSQTLEYCSGNRPDPYSKAASEGFEEAYQYIRQRADKMA